MVGIETREEALREVNIKSSDYFLLLLYAFYPKTRPLYLAADFNIKVQISADLGCEDQSSASPIGVLGTHKFVYKQKFIFEIPNLPGNDRVV